MELPHWELSVLSRAVAYPNLSGAAGNIGISQPQLSRIVARLEERVGVALLDRVSRRKSGWTPEAFRLAELYSSASSALDKQLQAFSGLAERRQIRAGTLEGLAPLAVAYCSAIFEQTGIELIELDVHEIHLLEEHFSKGALDLVFAPRLPGHRKPRYSRMLGYQSLERVATDPATHVISPFEHRTHKDTAGQVVSIPRASARVLVSNSLVVRRRWLESYGGTGLIPSAVRARGEPGARGSPVHLIASELFPAPLWRKIAAIRAEALDA